MPNAKDAPITDDLIEQVQRGSAQMSEGRATQLAVELYGRGRYKQAINVCRQIVQHKPSIADAHNILGASLAAVGNPKAGIAALRRAVKLAPNVSSYHANLGEVLRANGDAAEAMVNLTKAIQLDARNAHALNNLGIIHYDRREYQAAVDNYRQALAIQPDMPEAWNNLGNSLRLLGDKPGAKHAYEQALAHREVYPEAYNNLGTLLQELGKPDQAEHALRKAISQSPRYIDALNNLAAVYSAEGRDVEALRQLGDSLQIEPENAKTLLQVARVQMKRGSHDLAEQACRMVLARNPDSSDARLVLGQIKHDTDQYEEAVSLLEAAVKADPDHAEARNFYGVTLKSVGRLDEAREQILRAIELNESMYGAYANLNDLITFDRDHPLYAKIETLIHAEENSDPARVLPLHYAYAKALDDVGEHEAALAHYITGGQIKRSQLNYNESEVFGFADRIMATFTAERMAAASFAGNPSERPVFIVGMPRSGSTLVEQILSSHAAVHGAGEVKFLTHSIHLLRDRFPSLSRFPEIFDELDPARSEILANNYLSQIGAQAGSAARVTDKLLTNYFFLGLIHVLFPNARIINTQRNPIDNCLSAFTKLFKDDMPHSYDLTELGRYYRKYEELMAHWRQVIPQDRLMTIYYEDVVSDVEALARNVIAFIGLPWDDACVQFHKSDRPVKTASVAQVRRPIYRDSIERWRKYGPGLDPLIAALGDAGKRPV